MVAKAPKCDLCKVNHWLYEGHQYPEEKRNEKAKPSVTPEKPSVTIAPSATLDPKPSVTLKPSSEPPETSTIMTAAERSGETRRRYGSQAERQKAYRERKREEG